MPQADTAIDIIIDPDYPEQRRVFLQPDGERVPTLIELRAITLAYEDLQRREHELTVINSALKQQGEALSRLAHEIRKAQLLFDRDLSERQRLEAEWRRLTETDDLTGAYNRRAFLGELQTEMSRSALCSHRPTLLYLDIDFFKSINDSRGHATGDKVIKSVIQRIAAVLRHNIDRLGRLGGDEFAILLPETSIEGAMIVAERIRHRVAETPFEALDHMISVTVSIGIARWGDAADPDAIPEPVDDWIARADAALYLAKRAGRNAIRCAT